MDYKGIYDKEYYDKYVELGATPLAHAIYSGRWALILKYCNNGKILDYGCGPGFFNAHGPKEFIKLNYDVNPNCGFRELPKEQIDILAMWDSIEHIPNFYGEIKKLDADWLFITTPNLESVVEPIIHWKHYRPKEHLFAFDRHSLQVILADLGYQIVEMNYDEGKLRDPNRPQAILTVVAKKVS